MNDPYDARDNHVRIGDADRDYAIRILGVHFADGRLSITEYDDRCRVAAGATTRVELDQLFTDLPVLPNAHAGTDMEVYSAAEIAEQHRRGTNPRAGIMALTSIAAVCVAALLGGTSNVAAGVVLMVIPAIAILLYVLKVGPASWYSPSPQALERARVKRIRQAHQLQLEEKKAQRKIKQTELTTDALDIAHRAMGRAGRTVNNGWEQWRKKR